MRKINIVVIFFASFFLHGMEEEVPVIKYPSKYGMVGACISCGKRNVCNGSCKFFPLHQAVIFENFEDVKKLLNSNTIDQEDHDGCFSIDKTIFIKNPEKRFKITKFLLAAQQQKKDFSCLLNRHIEKYHVNEVALLLQHMTNAQLPIPSSSLSTVIALPFFHKEIADLLMKSINLNEQDSNGDTVLYHAVQVTNIKAFKVLIARGAAIDLQNKEQETLFHVLARNIRESRFGIYNLKIERETRFKIRKDQQLFVEMIFNDPKKMALTLLLIRKLKNSSLNQLPKPVFYMIIDLADPCCSILRNSEKLKLALLLKNQDDKTAYHYLLDSLEEEKKVYDQHNKKYNVKSTLEEDTEYWIKVAKLFHYFDPASYSN